MLELPEAGVLADQISILSRNTMGKSCPLCGSIIEKGNYMGGSIYFCPLCQKVRQ